MADGSGQKRSCDLNDTIASRFDRQVAALHDKLALVTERVSLTYRALDLEASRMAAMLASHPSQRNQPIMILMRDEASCVAAVLGALKTNHIVIPVAADSPNHWVAQVIADSGTGHIIVDESTRSMAELAATGRATVMQIGQLNLSSEQFVADQAASPDDTAYIVYTSGSTGQPKGVANSHRRLLHSNDARSRLLEAVPSDRHANLRSCGVGTWVTHTLLPLLSGGCLYSYDLKARGLQKLAPWLIDQQITHVSFSSSVLRAWLASLSNDDRFPALRFVWTTGEPIYTQDVTRIIRHLEGDWRIGHSYSSTETGLIAAQVFTASSVPDTGIIAVGRLVDGVEVSIRDETNASVPPGEIGEIVIRSGFLANGYWNNPDLTAKVFQTDPFDSAMRNYRTGDLGRWRSDGTLEHVGRKGRRIRLRGYNIEPFEVECALMCRPDIMDAVVLLHDAADEEPCLVGYIVAPPQTSPSAIRKGLAERLPSYMVPSYIVVLESFPLASSGKIDRTALPPPDRKAVRSRALRAPSDDHENQLLRIWQDVLKIPEIGIEDNFFELGGTSLQVLTVFARIATRLGCDLSPAIILQAPTITQLAQLIRAPTDHTACQLLTLRATGTGLPLFLVDPRMFYRHLLNDLKSNRPVFGLQPPPLDGTCRISHTIESLAAHYVTEIRRIQPHGPYYLAGYSVNGRVSFEIAQQLVHDGEPVKFLGMIDTIFHGTPVEGRPVASAALRVNRKVRAAQSVQDLLSRGMRYIKWRVLLLPETVKQEFLFRRYDRWIQQGRSVPYEHRDIYYERLGKRATRSYVPKPYPGHIVMFSSAGKSDLRRADWGPLAGGGITVLEVPAGHYDMVSPPFSKLLTEYFDACLDA